MMSINGDAFRHRRMRIRCDCVGDRSTFFEVNRWAGQSGPLFI